MDKAVPDQWASLARKNSCCLFKETLQHAEQNKNIFLKKKLFKSAVSTGPKLLTQLEWNVLPKKRKMKVVFFKLFFFNNCILRLYFFIFLLYF